MKEALVGMMLSGLTLVVAIGVFIYAAVKDRKPLRRNVGIVGGIALLLLGLSVFFVVRPIYRYSKQLFRARDGKEIYTVFFGEPVPECVQVTAFRDAVLPVIDYEICLEAETCPAEMRRILAQRAYDCGREGTSGMLPDSTDVFLPDFRQWGDSLCVCSLNDATDQHGRLLRFNTDSTRVYMNDY